MAWNGLCNYFLPAPSSTEYELAFDEETKTYWWYKSEKENGRGYKSWTGVKLAAWIHKLLN